MKIYAYKAPGTREERLRTQEAFNEYVNCGFNTIYLTGDNSFCFSGEEGWKNSTAKKCFDMAEKAGIEKVILRDNRLYIELIEEKDMLVGCGEGYRFQSEAELDEYVRFCMKDYIQEKLFCGLGLRDEPTYKHVKSVGLVYRSIKRVAKQLGKDDIYIQMNLNPLMMGSYDILDSEWREIGVRAAYEKYLDAFLTATGADIICVDNYPFRPSYIGGRFLEGFYIGYQILQEQCKKHGAELEFVLQSFELIHKTIPTAKSGFRKLSTVNEMFLQTNSALGFGVRHLSFYTYEPDMQPEDSPYCTTESSSLVTTTGEKTRIYYFAKAAIAHAKVLAETLESYSFTGARLFVHDSVKYCEDIYFKSEGEHSQEGLIDSYSTEFNNTHTLTDIDKIDYDKDVLLITELSNGADRLYMLQNVIDSSYKCDLKPMKLCVRWKDNKKCFKVFNGKNFTEKEFKDGMFETELELGEAAWVIISDK